MNPKRGQICYIKFDYKYGFNIYHIMSDDNIENISSNDDNHPLTLFLSMLDAPDSKRQYPKRLQNFFNFLNLEGDIRRAGSILCKLL